MTPFKALLALLVFSNQSSVLAGVPSEENMMSGGSLELKMDSVTVSTDTEEINRTPAELNPPTEEPQPDVSTDLR